MMPNGASFNNKLRLFNKSLVDFSGFITAASYQRGMIIAGSQPKNPAKAELMFDFLCSENT
jgi:hypothetical protein